MDFEHYAAVCRKHFGETARELTVIAEKHGVSELDMTSAKVALLIELSALLTVNLRCDREAFLDICADAFKNAIIELGKIPPKQ